MTMYADIALPVAVHQTFTYIVPPDLERSASIGTRAIVPFGRKYAAGLIISLPTSTNVSPLKPIKDILDPSPVVSDELLHLCLWIAEYYFAPLGEVLKAAIPHGFSTASKRLVQLCVPVEDARASARDMESRAPKRAKILQLIAEHGPMHSTDLQKKSGVKNIHALLSEMEKVGLLRTEEVLPRAKQTIKRQEIVLLDQVKSEELDAALVSLSPRKKKARDLLSTVRSLKGAGVREMPLSELLKKAKSSSAIVKDFRSILPAERRELARQYDYGTEEQTLGIVLNDSQRYTMGRLVDAIDSGEHKTFLLHGVTGSGKTQVYIEAIRHCLQQEKTAIVLVPEISLTPQIVRRFKSHFGEKVAVVHSRMSIGERYDAWRLALRGERKVVIGPRSAIFAPLANLGLIVVDEEHESSYKQFDAIPRYHARDVAIVRGSICKATVVLGTATPSIESYYNAMNDKYELLEMPRRVDDVRMPEITVVDMTAERKREYTAMKEALPDGKQQQLREFQQPSVSALLRQKIQFRLDNKEGIILLQNRRGFAPFVECVDCGFSETCDNCNVTLTYHRAKKHLRCHYCGLVRPPRTVCPDCHGQNLQLHGVGTQRVEEDLHRLFPSARILRMDLDTTSRKGAHDKILRKFGDGEGDILLGTQMVAKGLDFPRVTLVGVVSADTQMLLPDFRSSERTFQLLTQVAGRAGRSRPWRDGGQSEVIIQTHQPQHYTLQHVVDHDFRTFYEQELQARRELEYPPFSRIVLIETKGRHEGHVRQAAEQFARLLKGTNGAYTVLGPSPAVIARINNQYRWHIIIKNKKVTDPTGSKLRQVLRKAMGDLGRTAKRSVRLIIDVDPVGMM